MEVVGLSLLAGGTVANAAANYQQTQATVGSYKYNASVNERDIQVEKDRQQFREIQLSDQFQRAQGAAIAAYGKGGVGFTGSVLDNLTDQATQYEWNVAMSQFESTVAVNNLTDQKNMNLALASNAQKSGTLKMIGTLMTNVGTMGMSAYKAGVFDTKAAGTMTTAANNFSGDYGAALKVQSDKMGALFKSYGLKPINES